MIRRLVIAVCLAPLLACADIWPSWMSPASGGFDRGNQVVSGAVERLSVTRGTNAWTDFITPNIYQDYFAEASKLHAAKNMLKAALESDAYGKRWVYKTGDYNPTNAATITPSNLLAKLSLPTNWWDKTAYVATASHTNGYRFIPDVMKEMVALEAGLPITGSNNVWMYGLGYSEDSLEDAIAQAEADWTSIGASYLSVEAWVSTFFYFYIDGEGNGQFEFSASVFRSTIDYYIPASILASSDMTNLGCSVTVWNKCDAPSQPAGYIPLFNSQNDANVSSNWVALFDWTHAKNTDDLPPSVKFGSTGPDAIPESYEQPLSSGEGRTTGWDAVPPGAAWRVTYRYDVADGFKWFK